MSRILKSIGRATNIFIGGKGGVGKTVVAASLAYKLASNGEKVLLASLNPVHSLSNLFRQDLSGGVIKPVEGAPNLYAIEVEIADVVEKYKQDVSKRLREFLKWAEIPIDPSPFIEIATTNPAFQESAMFDKMLDIILNYSGQFDRIVFDTAAVANAIRLIGLIKIYDLWLQRLIKSREEALGLRAQLSFRKDKVMEEIKKDPLMLDLLSMRERFLNARSILTNPDKTRFNFVTLLQSLPISVVVRFMNSVKSYNIPTGGVVVNQVITRDIASRDPTGYLSAKYEEQMNYLRQLKDMVGEENIIAYIRQFPKDIVGLNMLRYVVEDMDNFTP